MALPVANWTKYRNPREATYDGQKGLVIAERANGTRMMFRTDPFNPDFPGYLDVPVEKVQFS